MQFRELRHRELLMVNLFDFVKEYFQGAKQLRTFIIDNVCHMDTWRKGMILAAAVA